MSLGSVGGTITSVVGLGVTLGALGLALEFTDRAFDRASPKPRRTGKRKPLFDTNISGKQRRQMAFDSGRDNINSVFDPMPRRSKSRKNDDPFGGFF